MTTFAIPSISRYLHLYGQTPHNEISQKAGYYCTVYCGNLAGFVCKYLTFLLLMTSSLPPKHFPSPISLSFLGLKKSRTWIVWTLRRTPSRLCLSCGHCPPVVVVVPSSCLSPGADKANNGPGVSGQLAHRNPEYWLPGINVGEGDMGEGGGIDEGAS